MGVRTGFQLPVVPEGTTALLSAVITDETSTAIAAATLSTLTLTLYPKEHTSTFINSRSSQDVLNTNNVTVTSSGVLTWTMQPSDNTIVDSSVSVEHHIALFQWTWPTSKAGKHEIEFRVSNLTNV